MLRDAGVRSKLFAVLAIPTALLVVATGWLVGGQVQTARQASQVEALTDVAIQVNRVVHSLQLERGMTLSYLQDPSAGNRSDMTKQRRFTSEQLRVLTAKVDASPLDQMSTSIRAAAARSTEAHRELADARRSIDAQRFLGTQTDIFYGRVIATDLQLPGAIAASADPELAQRLQAYGALSATIEYASQERDIIELAIADGTLNQAAFAQTSALTAQQRRSLQEFELSAPPELFASLDKLLANSDVYLVDDARRQLTELLNGRQPNVDRSTQWVAAANSRINPMVATEIRLVADIGDTASATRSDEQQHALIFAILALAGLALAVLLAFAVARQIALPLRRLTVAARELGEELPLMVERMQTPGEGPGVVVEPIPVESGDEIGRLAEAFNAVNEVTVRVAREQAVLRASIADTFVNVARRNQVLLGRQLAQLDQMEAREEDPDVLQNLFRLDHLATRMRRNAESLLVLAGIDSTRRLRNTLPISDVIRTAVGEIEAYERIDMSLTEDPEVSGRHALTIAHLLAELLENATHFSKPGTRVVVAAAVTGQGVDITVTDYGLGMNPQEIADANQDIAHPPVAEIAVSQRLGLFVVGRLAARLGATVVLRPGRSAGTVVTLALPASVFDGMQVEVEQPAEALEVSDVVEVSEVVEVVEVVEVAEVPTVADVMESDVFVPAFLPADADHLDAREAGTVEAEDSNTVEAEDSNTVEAETSSTAYEHVGEQGDEEALPVVKTQARPRRRLFGRRDKRLVPAGPSAGEAEMSDIPFVLASDGQLDQEDLAVAAEPVTDESAADQPVVEEQIVARERITQPDGLALSFDVSGSELVAELVEALSVGVPVAGPVAEPDTAATEAPVEEPAEAVTVAPRAEHGRGRFGRRRRHRADPVPTVDATADVEEMSAADAVSTEPFAAAVQEPPPVEVPAPDPAPVRCYAPAVDILPGKPMRGRGKHASPAPLPVAAVPPPAPPAPAPVAPAPVAVPAAALPTRTEALLVPATPVMPPPRRLAMSSVGAPVGPPLQAFAAPLAPPAPATPPALPTRAPREPSPISGPVDAAPAPLSELELLAHKSAMHSSALSELRGLYEPSFTPASAPAADDSTGLRRRTPRPAETVTEDAASVPPARTRPPSEVRGMLSGFRAGVERGRADPGPTDDAPDSTS